MERLWSLAVATSGNPSQMPQPENGSNRRKRLPCVATGCRDPKMVRNAMKKGLPG
jgi:hypothetical protein